MKVSKQDFVRIWETSRSLEEVAQRTGLSKADASRRASRYRKLIPLKEFNRGQPRLSF